MSKYLFVDIRVPIGQDNPSIMRHEERCIKYGQCKQVCRDVIGVENYYQVWKIRGTAIYIRCGRCINVCPVDCITEMPEWQKVREAVDDKDGIVILSTLPSARVALGESFEMEPESPVRGKTVALPRALGADYVLDTDLSTDSTIMEETNESIRRIQSDSIPTPQLASCCPVWVKFVETFYLEFKRNLPTSKSPIGIQGPTIKTYSTRKQGLGLKGIVNAVVTPRTAKKFETHRKEMCDAGKKLGIPGVRDMDCVIIAGELAEWAKPRGADFTRLKPERYDSLVGKTSGADVIFGNTGGVMKTAVHTAYTALTGEPAPENLLKLEIVHGMGGVREASLTTSGIKLDIAVVYGTANVGILLDRVKAGERFYQSIKAMAYPGGCIGGDGQLKDILADGDEIRRKRINDLYRKDESIELRLSHENPEITQMYDESYETSENERAGHMLHTAYIGGNRDLNQQ